MIRLKQAVIVEGKYDKIKLSNLLDALILTTDGFGIFKDKEKHNLSPVSQGGTRTYWNETKYRKDIKLIPQRYRKSYEMITNTCMPTNWTV